MKAASSDQLDVLLRGLRLPSFIAAHADYAKRAEKEGWTFENYLRELVCLELTERGQRRVARHRKESGLPADKTLATLQLERLPTALRRQISHLCEGDFVGRAENLLAFGLPGRGKTHCLCAIGHELVQRGHRVLFVPAFRLVQSLLAAKRDLRLARELRRLDAFDAIILDDIGYIQQDRDEMEVLFTLLAERYERRTVMISSNLVFSQWDRIFKDPMTTAAAIDRLVHHAVILELGGASYRTDEAKKRNPGGGKSKVEAVSSPEPKAE